jgi:predicted DNA-binding WGR domain protein
VAITELRTSLVNNPYPDHIRVDNSRSPKAVFAPYSLEIHYLTIKFSDTNTMEFKVLEQSGLQLQLTYGILGKDGFKNYKKQVSLKHLIKLLKRKVTEGQVEFKAAE